MWDDIQQHFSIGNGPRINKLRRHNYSCSQSGDSVVTYYGRLRKYWEELQNYLAPPCKCACKCGSKALLAKEQDDERTHQFLIGLDSTRFSHVQANMLMQDPLPSLNMVFSKAITEQRNLALMHTNEHKSEAIGISDQHSSRSRPPVKGRGNSASQSTTVTCTNCHKDSHTQEQCFELIGYLEWWYAENRAAARGRGGFHGGRGSRGGTNNRGTRSPAVAHAMNDNSTSNTPYTLNENDHAGVLLLLNNGQI